MDYYNKLELIILQDFGKEKESVLQKAGLIIVEATYRSPNTIRDRYYYEWATVSDKLRDYLKAEQHDRSENLEPKINELIEYFMSIITIGREQT